MNAAVSFAKVFLRISSAPFIALMLLAGAALLVLRPRWGRRWVIGVALAFWFVSTPLGSRAISFPLAYGYGPIQDQREAGAAGAIVVLGGGIQEASAGPVRLGHVTRDTALRVVESARVFRLLGGEPFVVASGGIPPEQSIAEGDVIASSLEALQVPRGRILVDRASRTTREQAIGVTAMLRAKGVSRFVIVTSPVHMRRAFLAFRAVGADVIPSTAPYGVPARIGVRMIVPNGYALQLSDAAVYDGASMVYYWMRGWYRPATAAGR